jgi:hypothetical protein
MEVSYYEMRFLNCTYLIRIQRSAPPPPLALVTSVLFTLAQQSLVVQGFRIIKGSRSHSGTPHLVGIPWTSDQPDAETSTRQPTTRTTDRHPYPWRDSNSQSQQVSGRSPTP